MIKGPSNVAGSNVIHNNIQSRGVLMTSNPPEPPSKKNDIPEINIKTELIIEDTDTGNNNETMHSENSNVAGSKTIEQHTVSQDLQKSAILGKPHSLPQC